MKVEQFYKAKMELKQQQFIFLNFIIWMARMILFLKEGKRKIAIGMDQDTYKIDSVR